MAYVSLCRVFDALLSLGYQTLPIEIDGVPVEVSVGRGLLAPGEQGLLLLIVHDGVSLKVPRGNVAPGCRGMGPGLAIPRTGADIDNRALSACVGRLIGADVATPSALRRVFVMANPGTPFREIVDVRRALNVAGAEVRGFRVL